MRCALCLQCEESEIPGRCVYGGPYAGLRPDRPIDEAAYIARKYGPPQHPDRFRPFSAPPRSWADYRERIANR